MIPTLLLATINADTKLAIASAKNTLAIAFQEGAPFLATIAISIIILSVADRYLRSGKQKNDSFTRPLVMIAMTAIAVIAAVITLPVETATRGNLLTLMGLVLSAVIGLASTTFLSNAMAGLLLRSLGKFKPGDFLRTEDHFGRVTERGLFHTELQTEESDLVTLPNFFLVTRPIKVVRAQGTIINADVSIGYDEPESRIRELLISAAESANLTDTYAHVRELGDFSITYRAAGMLDDPTKLLAARSALRAAILNTLHNANVEIASPTIMAQRPLTPNTRLVPVKAIKQDPEQTTEHEGAEQVAFEKANRAAFVEQLKEKVAELDASLADKDTDISDARREALARKREIIQAMIESEANSDS